MVFKMNHVIKQAKYDKSLQMQVKHALRTAAKDATGIDEWDGKTFSFVAYQNEEIGGAIVFDIIYGQMLIDYMFVSEGHRHKGIGSELLNTAKFEYSSMSVLRESHRSLNSRRHKACKESDFKSTPKYTPI
jgi:GNAT superfamily N-acetyltransferase